MRVLVVTVVHDPRDARIRVRQIAALRDAGHEVAYAAPFSDCAVSTAIHEGETFDLPRAQGRRRIDALIEARRLLRRVGRSFDVVVIHDPELLIAARAVVRRHRAAGLLWDVHEDVTALASQRSWVPAPLAPALRLLVRSMVRWAERHATIMLAEDSYHHAFAGTHPVVPNAVPVPEGFSGPVSRRVVYVGHLTRQRGALDMLEAARLLGSSAEIHLIGNTSSDVADQVAAANDEGVIAWHGFVPNEDTGALVDGALAGLAVLHDLPNYRHALPTKLAEYGAYGVPCIVTPNPASEGFVARHGGGLVVPFNDPQAIADAVIRLASNRQEASAMSQAARATTDEGFSWEAHRSRFLDVVVQASQRDSRSLA